MLLGFSFCIFYYLTTLLVIVVRVDFLTVHYWIVYFSREYIHLVLYSFIQGEPKKTSPPSPAKNMNCLEHLYYLKCLLLGFRKIVPLSTKRGGFMSLTFSTQYGTTSFFKGIDIKNIVAQTENSVYFPVYNGGSTKLTCCLTVNRHSHFGQKWRETFNLLHYTVFVNAVPLKMVHRTTFELIAFMEHK